jgi:hypothetical protein
VTASRPLSLVTAVAVVVLPKCPVCWLGYAAVLSSAGLGSVPYQPWLLPATAVSLALTAGSLWWRAGRRWSHRPALLALAGAALVIAGKFWIDQLAVMGSGILLLAGSVIWDVLAGRQAGVCGGNQGACHGAARL